jgi:acyl carrier protein
MKAEFGDVCRILESIGIDKSKVTPGADFSEDLDMDSTELVDLCSSIKKEFKVDIHRGDCTTVDNLLKRMNTSV